MVRIESRPSAAIAIRTTEIRNFMNPDFEYWEAVYEFELTKGKVTSLSQSDGLYQSICALTQPKPSQAMCLNPHCQGKQACCIVLSITWILLNAHPLLKIWTDTNFRYGIPIFPLRLGRIWGEGDEGDSCEQLEFHLQCFRIQVQGFLSGTKWACYRWLWLEVIEFQKLHWCAWSMNKLVYAGGRTLRGMLLCQSVFWLMLMPRLYLGLKQCLDTIIGQFRRYIYVST